MAGTTPLMNYLKKHYNTLVEKRSQKEKKKTK